VLFIPLISLLSANRRAPSEALWLSFNIKFIFVRPSSSTINFENSKVNSFKASLPKEFVKQSVVLSVFKNYLSDCIFNFLFTKNKFIVKENTTDIITVLTWVLIQLLYIVLSICQWLTPWDTYSYMSVGARFVTYFFKCCCCLFPNFKSNLYFTIFIEQHPRKLILSCSVNNNCSLRPWLLHLTMQNEQEGA
jgi:hypothetical protein